MLRFFLATAANKRSTIARDPKNSVISCREFSSAKSANFFPLMVMPFRATPSFSISISSKGAFSSKSKRESIPPIIISEIWVRISSSLTLKPIVTGGICDFSKIWTPASGSPKIEPNIDIARPCICAPPGSDSSSMAKAAIFTIIFIWWKEAELLIAWRFRAWSPVVSPKAAKISSPTTALNIWNSWFSSSSSRFSPWSAIISAMTLPSSVFKRRWYMS